MDEDKKSFGKWLKENAFDIAVYAGAAVLVTGAAALCYVAIKEEMASIEAARETAKANLDKIVSAYSRGARVLAGPGSSTWILEGDTVELVY